MESGVVSYLFFDLHSALYGLRTSFVREIIWLPELTPLEEAAPCIAGVFNLRGSIVPVMDLDIRFDHQPRRYQTSNSIVVLEAEGRLMGVIVDEALDVNEISLSDIEAPQILSDGKSGRHSIEGEAKFGEKIIMILDAAQLVKQKVPPMEIDQLSAPAHEEQEGEVFTQRLVFCPDATQRERELFRDRAKNLSRKDEVEARSGLIPMAVVGVGGEVFGIDARFVREFTEVRRITPVPCCPPHILGNMNLRGNIITVVDVRNLLALPIVGSKPSKAVIAKMGETPVGLAVNEVLDVAYLRREELVSAPPGGVADKYVKGTASYGGRLMTALDLERILNDGALVVNEET